MKRVLIIAALLSFVPSCAYMQTSKQVAEIGCIYPAKQLTFDNCSTWNIYKHRGKWYISAKAIQLKKKYPTFKDTLLFVRNNEPWYELSDDTTPSETLYYHTISEGTAKVLLMSDGYASIADLAKEIRDTPGEWVQVLPGAKAYGVKAQLEGISATNNSYIIDTDSTYQRSLANKVLSTADCILVDVPGTVAYNVLIPFMAPFKFFSDFLSNN